VAEAPPLGLELRQVAGLSAGFTQTLPAGEHHFGAGSGNAAGDVRTKPFTLTVDENNTAWITTSVNVRLDGQVVKGRTAVDRGIIDAGSARFVVSPSRPPTRRRGGNSGRVIAKAVEAPPAERIRIAEYMTSPEPPERKKRFGRATDREASKTSPLIDRILEIRRHAVQYERSRVPDSGQLMQMVMAGADHMGHVEPGDDGFANIPIAYGDLLWQPPIDRPDRIPSELVIQVQQQSILPSVPLFVNLTAGHLGIVGDRDACLAVVRQIAVTLRVLSPVDAITFSVLRAEGSSAEWNWLDSLPRSDSFGLPVTFFDGIHQVREHEMRQSLLEGGTGGAVIIDDQLHDIPSLCKTVLEIQPSGTAALLDFNRGATTTRVATPLGFDLATTNDFAEHLRRI
ncbi:MAG: hypothetical protein KJN63_12260, partial [Acidimicrobiia bacterium]|nr:hypothetical protein [Acidimicrobiia bacterium]